MTHKLTENETELREAVVKIIDQHLISISSDGRFECKGYVKDMENEFVTLITSDKQRLLQGLMEQKQNYHKRIPGKPYSTSGFKGISNIYYESGHEAIPLSVIQNKLEGLS